MRVKPDIYRVEINSRLSAAPHGAKRAVASVLLLIVTAATMIAAPSNAMAANEPQQIEYDFFVAPKPLPKGSPGELIRYASTPVSLGPGVPTVKAWHVMYHSRDAVNRDVPVTGTVMVPTTAWAGSGPRPVVSYAVGSHGLANRCAPSRTLVAGGDVEGPLIGMALSKGWAVVVTDYFGYTTGDRPSYIVGQDMGHAVLDIVRAARRVPGAGVDGNAKVATWGYSQGGAGTGWADSLQPSYAPDVQLIAGASGGVPADLKLTLDFLDGGAGSGTGLWFLMGPDRTYGGAAWPFRSQLSPAGETAVADAAQACSTDLNASSSFQDLDNYFAPPYDLASFEALPSVTRILKESSLVNAPAPKVPVLQYHGAPDEFVPFDTVAVALHRSWCAQGVKTRLDTYPSEHLATAPEAAPAAIQWLDDAFSGRPLLTNCLT
jgi:hypothetical protein